MSRLSTILLAACLAVVGCDAPAPAPSAGSDAYDDALSPPPTFPEADGAEAPMDTVDSGPVEDVLIDAARADTPLPPDSAPPREDAAPEDTPEDTGTQDDGASGDAPTPDALEDGEGPSEVTPPTDAASADGAGADDVEASDGLDGAADAGPCMTCVGAEAPAYSLVDFQPASPGFETSYGLEAFQGQVTLVGLLATWCGYCKLQATMLEEMSFELELEGADVHMVLVNKVAAESTQQNFIDIVSFPLLQDVAEVDAWALHQGNKDDLYIYGPTGDLITYLPHGGEISTNLSTDEGYQNVLQALLDAVKSTSAL